MKKLIILWLAVFLVGCVNIRTYYRNDYELEFKELYKGLAILETKAVLTAESGEQVDVNLKAMAIVLDNGKVLTLTHASEVPLQQKAMTFFGPIQINFKSKMEKHFINGKEVKLIGRHKDISLFQSDLKVPFAVRFGDSNLVEVGDKVLIIGFSFTDLINAKDGIISALDAGQYQERTEEKIFMHTAPINPGDSGSPLIAFKFGKPEIIGIVNAALRDKGMGFAIKINEVKDAIAKIVL